MRVTVNRGACCHVAGDIDFDTHGNLWLVTGDDSAAGSGDAGNWGQSIDQKTDENQTVRVDERDGRHVHADVQRADDRARSRSTPRPRRSQAALGALSNIGAANIQATGGPVNTANVLVTWKGTFEEQDVATLTSNATGLTGTTPTVTIGVGAGAGGQQHHRASGRPLAHAGGRLGALRAEHERPARQGPPDHGQGRRHHAGRGQQGELRLRRRVHDPGRQPVPARRRAAAGEDAGPRSTRWASGTRSGSRSTRTTSRTSATTRPTRRRRSSSTAPPGTGRFEIVRHPANYGWPYCFKPDLPEYPWNVNLQVPMNLTDHQPVPAGQTPQPYPCDGATMPNNDYWNVNGGPSVQPGLTTIPASPHPDIWYSYRDNNARDAARHAVLRRLRPGRADAPAGAGLDDAVPAPVPGAVHGRRGPARDREVRVRPGQPEPD